jgi:hypothetical protein
MYKGEHGLGFAKTAKKTNLVANIFSKYIIEHPQIFVPASFFP